jgi:transposase
MNVEADDFGISVHIYVKNHTRWWEKNRWKQIWHILTRGYAQMDTTIVLSEQTALNYSEALKNAITDVKQFKTK